MQTIRRKTLLYKSRISEVGHCVTHALGCSHGCRYPCHAFLIAQRHGRVPSYEAWRVPKLVENAPELLERDLKRFAGKLDFVSFSLATDPFMQGYPEVGAMTLRLIERINAAGIPCRILTKGLLPAELADARFHPGNEYGISLVSLNERFREQWEPGATPYAQRIAALKALHDAGRATWVHMEPYPTPNLVQQDVRDVLEAVSFTDDINFGRLNYNPLARQCVFPDRFYKTAGDTVRAFCAEHGIECSVFA